MSDMSRPHASHFSLAGCLGAILVLAAGQAQAEIVTIDVTVKSIDAEERAITVTRSSRNKSKDIDLEISKKARILIDDEDASLDDVHPGQRATISYETELEIVTRIEIVDGGGDGDLTPDEMPAESAELKETGCLVVWSIDETGNSTVTIGRPPVFSEPASDSLIRHDDNTIEFQHDLNTPGSVLQALMSRAENTRFDRELQALVLTPKAGRNRQAPLASFAYSKLAHLPLVLVYEFEGVGDGNASSLEVQLRAADADAEFPALNLFSDDGFAASAVVRPTWNGERNRRGEPQATSLMEEQLVKLGEPQEFSFNIPLQEDDQRYVLEFSVQGDDAPTALRRLSVRGRLTPTLGIALAQAGGMVVAERVMSKGLGESAGVRTGDIIVSINGIKPRSVREAMECMGGIRFGDESEIVVNRGGRNVRINFLAE